MTDLARWNVPGAWQGKTIHSAPARAGRKAIASSRAHIHHNPPAAVNSARTRAETMARLKREGAANGADAIAGALSSLVAGLLIRLLKILLNRRKPGAGTHFVAATTGAHKLDRAAIGTLGAYGDMSIMGTCAAQKPSKHRYFVQYVPISAPPRAAGPLAFPSLARSATICENLRSPRKRLDLM